jgi:hypothetical protein
MRSEPIYLIRHDINRLQRSGFNNRAEWARFCQMTKGFTLSKSLFRLDLLLEGDLSDRQPVQDDISAALKDSRNVAALIFWFDSSCRLVLLTDSATKATEMLMRFSEFEAPPLPPTEARNRLVLRMGGLQ